MSNNSEIRAKTFVSEHDRLDPSNPITPEIVLRLHFDGILNRYIETTENIAEKLRPNDLETAHRLTAGIVFAGKRSIGITLHILDKFAEHDPKTFLAMLRHALDDEATQRNLASIVRSGPEDPEIQALIDYHRLVREDDVIEVTERSQDLDSVTERFDDDAEPVERTPKAESDHRRKLTVAEARRRVMAQTGRSERSIIRQTKGWDADAILFFLA